MAKAAARPRVAIVMGSDSDLACMADAARALDEFSVPYELGILSAHRTPKAMATFAETAADRGFSVIIAGAGGAAHLPGMIAAHTTLPVIGVPVPIGHLSGQDALYSIVQMPKGVPVATVAIGGAFNAGVLAAQMLAAGGDKALRGRLERYKTRLRELVEAKDEKLRSHGR
ncbi:MAG: 5-(carboxyamino)imidazole ribonucleotide mutase [Deltaproteobacteria bacterium]|nr:5-(carboxyamino)imidazole ribonucleotide mutase [Deltaproteobacteria bacterium]